MMDWALVFMCLYVVGALVGLFHKSIESMGCVGLVLGSRHLTDINMGDEMDASSFNRRRNAPN